MIRILELCSPWLIAGAFLGVIYFVENSDMWFYRRDEKRRAAWMVRYLAKSKAQS